jgi:alkylation response protein AidB-like acyl-CoA dehydrogenase
MSAPIELLYSDVEDSLRESVGALLRKRCTPELVRSVVEQSADNEQTRLWQSFGTELGLAGLLVPEELGGSGGTAREAAVVLEEIGRFVAPLPFLTSSVIATIVLLEAGAADLLLQLADGTETAALLMPFECGASTQSTTIRKSANGELKGRVRGVPGALGADWLLAPVKTDDGVEIHVINAADPGLRITRVSSLDMTRQLADIELRDIGQSRISDETRGRGAIALGLQAGAAMLASEQLGIAEWCFATTVAYLRERRQFGRAIGGYQAIKHRVADMWVELGLARSVARYAAATAAADHSDREMAASLAQALCSKTAVHLAEECIQLHGGVGMTWEHQAHLYLKRAKADQIAIGTAGEHRRHLAELVNLPRSAAS